MDRGLVGKRPREAKLPEAVLFVVVTPHAQLSTLHPGRAIEHPAGTPPALTLPELELPVPRRHPQHRATVADRRADAARVELTLDLEVEVRADGAVPRGGLELAVVVRGERQEHVAAAGAELHVVPCAQGRHPHVDVAVAAAHLDGPLHRHDVDVAVAGRDVDAVLHVAHLDVSIAGRDADLSLRLHDPDPAVPRRGLNVAPGALDAHRAVARGHLEPHAARHEHGHRHGHGAAPPAVVPAVPIAVARVLAPCRTDLDATVARLS